ncbi:hypothetical protein B0H34DRAFT_668976, partial [Crassisporium funariophilum]
IQCSLPVFEGLLPEPHNETVMDLLFTLCKWHTLAKLRLHTSSTLEILKNTTRNLGNQIRNWVKKTCAVFDTHELPKEESARHRAASTSESKDNRDSDHHRNAAPLSKLRKLFNMCTYKLHSLGDYVAAIARYGTTDGYSTQVVSYFNCLSLIPY